MKRQIGSAQPRWVEAKKHWRLDVHKNGKRKSFYSSLPGSVKGPAECRRKAEAWLASLPLFDGPSVADVIDEYLEYRRPRVRRSTLQEDRKFLNHYLRPALGDRPIASITKKDWQAVMNCVAQRRKTKNSLGIAVSALSRAAVFAARQGYIEDAAVPRYLAYEPSAPPAKKQIFTEDEIRRIFSPELDPDPLSIYPRVLLLTGLRRGELIGLGRDDLIGNALRVRHSLDIYGERTKTKTGAGERTIYLSPYALELITKHQERAAALGYDDWQLLPHISDKGVKPMLYRALVYWWKCFARRHDIRALSLHEFRHTFISYTALRAGEDLGELKKLYGHEASMKTEAVYVHDEAKTEAQRLEEAAHAQQIGRKAVSVLEELIGKKSSTESENRLYTWDEVQALIAQAVEADRRLRNG